MHAYPSNSLIYLMNNERIWQSWFDQQFGSLQIYQMLQEARVVKREYLTWPFKATLQRSEQSDWFINDFINHCKFRSTSDL